MRRPRLHTPDQAVQRSLAPAAQTAGPDALLRLQRSVGNNVVQRLIAGAGTTNEGEEVAASLADEFVRKHVAESKDEAITKTLARINNNEALKSMVDGKLGNTLATAADWRAAITKSPVEVPEEFDWEPGSDGTDRFHNAPVVISGMEVTRTAPLDGRRATKASVRELTDVRQSVGGSWTVAGDTVSAEADHASTGRP